MNIGVIVRHFRTEGGLERAAVELSSSMVSKGHQITIFASSCSVDLPDGMRCVNVPAWSMTNSTEFLTFCINSRRAVKSVHFDILHAHGTDAGMGGVITAHSCHRAGMDVRRRLGRTARPRRNFHIADTFLLAAERRTFREGGHKRIIAVSNGVKRELREYYDLPEEDIVVIPNGVNPREFFPASDDEKTMLKKSLNFHPDDFILLFVANEFDRKGLRYILEALTLLKSKNIKLLVVGKDNPKPYLEYSQRLGLTDRVRFAGLQRKLTTYYQLSDVFVLPTYYEAFSLATIEAAACGVPLLVTKVNGTEDFVKDGVNGFFIQRAADSIALQLTILVNDERKRIEMGERSRKSAQEYSWDKIADRTLALYHEVVNLK